MKTAKRTFWAVMVWFAFSIMQTTAWAYEPIVAMVIKKFQYNGGSESETPVEQPGRRLPSIRMKVVLDYEAGVIIPNLDSSEILSYQVWNEEGEMMYTTTDERSFLDFVFNLGEGFYEVVMTTQYVEYIGTINI